MLDLFGELELGLMEENVFWNINKSSLNRKRERKRKKLSKSNSKSKKRQRKKKL